jgi:peptidoglycan/xylan/chitin deacetylase (PgdA/CDA1 family)
MLRFHRACRLVAAILTLVVLAGLLSSPNPGAAHKLFRVYLTFDDGPIPGETNRILEILKKYNVKATFFVQGSHIHGNELYVRQELLEGHHIGNHLISHENNIMAPARPPDTLIVSKYNEVDGAIRWALGGLAGQWDQEEPIKPFRWPGGAAKAIPLPNVITYNWTSATNDSGKVYPYGALIRALYGAPEAHEYGVFAWGDGAVLLMHDWSNSSIAALPLIIENLQENGATFDVLPRPGDQPGTMPIVLGDAPPCAKHNNSCTPVYMSFSFKNWLPVH